jgi:hypothetical protein
MSSTHGHDFSRWSTERHVIYDPIYKPCEVYFTEHNNWAFIELAAMFGDCILELGAHSGLACLAIKTKYDNKTAIASDVNLECCKQMVQRFKYWNKSDIPVVCCDAFNLPFRDKSVSVCFSVGLLEHYEIDDSVKLIKEQLRVARYCIFDVPTEKREYGYGDERYRKPEEWIEIARSVGKMIHYYARSENTCGMVIEDEGRV